MKPACARVSFRRILALAVAIGCHVVVLLALLMPATPDGAAGTVAQMRDAQIKIRWVPSRSPATTKPIAVSSAAHTTTHSTRPLLPHATRPEMTRPTISDSKADAPSRLVLPNTLALPSQHPATSGAVADAGFHDRVRDAQDSRDVRGIPGSDRRIVPDIALTEPRKQGLGSVLRNVQRLFGITQRACIDVDAMRQLTTEELIARHLTQEGLNKQAEKYQCNEPLGLHF